MENIQNKLKNIWKEIDTMSQKSYNNTPTVYLIPTPIGNMEDMTYRAVRILNEVEVVFSEDTRVTSLLFQHFNIHKKMISSHKFNEEKNGAKMLEYLRQGYSVGIVSDRGTPVISDPGYELARYAIQEGYNVVGLPGATALIPALIMSGISPMPFLFYGFLNNKDGKRKKELEELKKEKSTLIFYEAPHRLEKTLRQMQEILGNRHISISREISKKFEEVYRGTILDVLEQIKDAKGEFVIVVEGNLEEEHFEQLTIMEHIHLYMREGKTSKEAIKMVAKERNLNKNEVYKEYNEKK